MRFYAYYKFLDKAKTNLPGRQKRPEIRLIWIRSAHISIAIDFRNSDPVSLQNSFP